MHLAFLNPQGNFDPQDRYWTQHPDFGGQLVYVKQVALALGTMGHRIDIFTRRIRDPQWPGFADPLDGYPGAPNVRIVRIPAGPDHFLPKEELWPHIGADWVPGIIEFYRREGRLPDIFTAHYGDGGLAGVLIAAQTGIPFTFTAHSLGAQKMDQLGATPENLAALDARYHFARRLVAERLSMNRSAVNITSTRQERFEQYGHRAYRGAVDVHDDRRFAVVPPGVNRAIFDPDARAENEEWVHQYVRACLERDIREDRRDLPAIVLSSRLEPKKNPIGLILAFARNPHLRERANVVLITAHLDDPLRTDEGSSPAEQEVLGRIRRAVGEHNLWGEISAMAISGQASLAAAYRFLARHRSVFALTALYEPFGLAPLEAAATGLPVVVTRNGGPAEIWQEDGEEYGILVDPADPDNIARGLMRVLADPLAWEHFACRGRERVLARYTWERTAEGYLSVAQRVQAGHFRPAERPLPIPLFFQDPRPENDIPLDELHRLYFEPEVHPHPIHLPT